MLFAPNMMRGQEMLQAASCDSDLEGSNPVEGEKLHSVTAPYVMFPENPSKDFAQLQKPSPGKLLLINF